MLIKSICLSDVLMFRLVVSSRLVDKVLDIYTVILFLLKIISIRYADLALETYISPRDLTSTLSTFNNAAGAAGAHPCRRYSGCHLAALHSVTVSV